MEKELYFFFKYKDYIQKDKDKLIFFNKTNETEFVEININNDKNIDISVPIKGLNYYYKTKLFNINNIINYLNLHI
tara:strand:+ start:450 stop:677 length:228 start_codon:yes stop_codon:yes gene_type:complete